MATITAPVGFANVSYEGIGVAMLGFEGGNQRILRIDCQDFRMVLRPQTDDVFGHDVDRYSRPLILSPVEPGGITWFDPSPLQC